MRKDLVSFFTALLTLVTVPLWAAEPAAIKSTAEDQTAVEVTAST